MENSSRHICVLIKNKLPNSVRLGVSPDGFLGIRAFEKMENVCYVDVIEQNKDVPDMK